MLGSAAAASSASTAAASRAGARLALRSPLAVAAPRLAGPGAVRARTYAASPVHAPRTGAGVRASAVSVEKETEAAGGCGRRGAPPMRLYPA